MKILMYSTDGSIFEKSAESRERMISYGSLCDELHVVVCALGSGAKAEKIASNVTVYPTNSKSKLARYFDGYIVSKKILLSRMSSGDEWVITTQDPFEIGLVGMFLARKFSLPLQAQIHTDFRSRYFSSESLLNHLRVWIAGIVIKRADAVRVVSQRIVDSLFKLGVPINKITEAPIFVNTKKLSSAKESDFKKRHSKIKFLAFMASRLTREKNIYLALRAMKSVCDKYKDAGLLVVGDGPEKKRLEAYAKEISLKNVFFESWTGNLGSYYKAADVFIISSNYEGYGRTAVEAMSQGLPVVMTDTGLAREVVIDGQNGLIVPVGGDKGLGLAVARLHENKDLLKRLSLEAKKTAVKLPKEQEYLSTLKSGFELAFQRREMNKICYVLPEFNSEAATHFYYNQQFIKEAGKELKIYLLVEKGEAPPQDLGYEKLYFAGSANFGLRTMQTVWGLLKARLLGYKNFYVHYSFDAAFWASIIAKLSGGKVFYWNCGEPWKFKRGFWRDLFEKGVYRFVDYLVTGGRELGYMYAKNYGFHQSKVKVLPNWVDTERFSKLPSKTSARRALNIPLRKKVILFVHRLSARKGSDMILPTAKILLKNTKDTFFAVVGSGPDEEAMKKSLSGDTLLQLAVSLRGSVPNKDIVLYYAAADALFLPSMEEGVPHVALEALAAGLPYVASDVGAIKEITPDILKKFIVANRTPDNFARKLGELLNAVERGDMVLEAGKYDISKITPQFIKLFDL